MISVPLAAFLAFGLSITITVAFILHLSDNRFLFGKKKKIDLKKYKCEICGLASFPNPSLAYWRCPDCKSLNKIEK